MSGVTIYTFDKHLINYNFDKFRRKNFTCLNFNNVMQKTRKGDYMKINSIKLE